MQASENKCRVTLMTSVMPRLSRSSAMSVVDLPTVPRSITRDSRNIAPGASAGSHTDPARIAMLMVTAGIVRVSLAMTTAPFDSTARDG